MLRLSGRHGCAPWMFRWAWPSWGARHMLLLGGGRGRLAGAAAAWSCSSGLSSEWFLFPLRLPLISMNQGEGHKRLQFIRSLEKVSFRMTAKAFWLLCFVMGSSSSSVTGKFMTIQRQERADLLFAAGKREQKLDLSHKGWTHYSRSLPWQPSPAAAFQQAAAGIASKPGKGTSLVRSLDRKASGDACYIRGRRVPGRTESTCKRQTSSWPWIPR